VGFYCKASSGSSDPLLFKGSRYFFTQAFFASSHFMSFVFSQSALVFGASAANAGAETASSRPAMIAVLKILADIGASSFDLGHPGDDYAVSNRDAGVRDRVITSSGGDHDATSSDGGASGGASTLG
jgi:hypothetical protein